MFTTKTTQQFLTGTILSFLALVSTPAYSQTDTSTQEAPGQYVCWPLEDALRDLRSKGLNVIYSSDRVRPEMQVTSAPTASTPRAILDEILRPFDLKVKESDQGVLLIVGGATSEAERPTPEVEARGEGVLPIWIERSQVAEFSFPETMESPLSIPKGRRFMMLHVNSEDYSDWQKAAFDLKNLILSARTEVNNLKVALAGEPVTVHRLVALGLEPYVDAYVYRQTPSVPASDPTGRSWRLVSAPDHQILKTLLESASRGDEVVIFEKVSIDSLHEAFLGQIQETESADLFEQPRVLGTEQRLTRFFQHPSTGDLFLAIYAEGPKELRFSLSRRQKARLLFPAGESFSFHSDEFESTLGFDGLYPYYLFQLSLAGAETPATDVDVTTQRYIDPYEEVVKNQVFQESQYERFESLDVMEYISSFGQYSGASQTNWEHRIMERKGQSRDYHHLGLTINGAPYPTKKLLKGRISRNEALLRLRPLEVELNETYHYDYLGEEIVDGHPTYRIGYKPIVRDAKVNGSLVSGVLWLDQETNAHRRIRTVQTGMNNGTISVETTYQYEWIPSNGQCWWDWTTREGTGTTSYGGQLYGYNSETFREEFKFNRPDIDQAFEEAYASEVMIHVEMPPDGHRWLVKNEEGSRRVGGATEIPSVEPAPIGASETELSDVDYGPRTLADVHAFSRHASFSVFGSDDDSEVYPGFTISDSDLFDRGVFAYAGFYLEEARVGFGIPNFPRQTWSFEANLYLPYEATHNISYSGNQDGVFDSSAAVIDNSLSLSLSMPLGRRSSFSFVYSMTDLDFESLERSDERFVLPQDTKEHSFDLSVSNRWSKYTLDFGYEFGVRDRWESWGLDGQEPLKESFQVARIGMGRHWRVKKHSNMSFSLAYWKAWDLDRFSRRNNGDTRLGIAGFGDPSGYDNSKAASLSWGTHLWKLPLNFRLLATRSGYDDYPDERVDRTSLRFRFLINGPFKFDIWPTITYILDSSINGESGEIRTGVYIRRRK